MRTELILPFLFVISIQLSAQINLSKVAVDVGFIRNFQNAVGNEVSNYSFYPELHLGGSFLTKYSEWDVYWGYWTDGVKEPFKIMDAITYSYSGQLAGTRIYFYPQNVIDEFILPLKFAAGVSYHFIKTRYVGGTDYIGDRSKDSRTQFLTFDLGLGSEIKVINSISIGLEGNLYFPSKLQTYFNGVDVMSSLKAGLIYNF